MWAVLAVLFSTDHDPRGFEFLAGMGLAVTGGAVTWLSNR
jgi:hypothetical protein